MSTYRDKGIVLRVRALKDADRQYVVFTEHHGKISLIARGTRHSKSKMSPHLGTYGVVDLMVAKGKRVDRLAGASLERSVSRVGESIERSSLAQAFFTAVDGLTRRDQPDERLFSLLAGFLDVLASRAFMPDGARPSIFDCGIAKLFDFIGVGLELGACVRCRNPLVPDGNGLNVIRGGVECASCRDDLSMSVSSGAIKTLRFFRNESLRASSILHIPMPVRREVAFVIDLLLADHLDGRVPLLRYLAAVAGRL